MRAELVLWARKLLLLLVVLAVAAGAISTWSNIQSTHLGNGRPLPLLKGLFRPPQTLAGRHIGIVAGHSGNDSGAVCPDGLTEASVNLKIATAAANEMRSRGAQVDLLKEFDTHLTDYVADAFVSIHADSCQVDLSGFKVASLAGGSKASEQLADCLWTRFETTTSLPRHPATITFDMRDYHAFKEIAPSTPAAIIETGFLKADRDLLTRRSDLAAAGIVSGVECFLVQNPGR